jgi:POTRA domain-containing FtsQ-type protein/cell division protein FtsQ
MENKKPKEQIAFNYRGRISPRSASQEEAPGRGGTGAPGRSKREEQSSSASINPDARRRVVTMPQEIVQPTRWADRQAHQRSAHAEPRTRNRSVKRTLARTGMPAPDGQIRLIRPLPRPTIAAQVPVRSGRQHARNGSFWRRFLTLFALLAIGILGVSFALSSTNFRVQQIDIMGTQNRKLVDSIQNMDIQGQNIFLLDVGELTTRIEALPMVASANLSKQLPNLVIINIVERTPVLLWQTQQGTFSVDSKGVVIAPASDTTGTDHLMTVVDARDGAAQQVHPGALLNKADIAFATQVFARLPQLSGISSFTLRYDVVPRQGGHGSFIVVSSNGWLAYLGGADDNNPLDNRLIEFQQILSMAQQKQLNLATIDLRFGLRPVYTLRG